MKCRVCGEVIPDDAIYCPACGEQTAPDFAENREPAERAWQETRKMPDNSSPARTVRLGHGAKGGTGSASGAAIGEPEPSRGMKTAIVIGAIVGLVAIAVILGVFYLSGNRTATVSFDTGGGTAVAAEDVASGSTVSKPEDPTRDGYLFSGWYFDEACTREADLSRWKPDRDATLYAKWTKAADPDSGDSGSDVTTYTELDASNSALKGYFSDMQKASDQIATAAKHFNASFKKGPNARKEVENELDSLQLNVFETLWDTDSSTWKVNGMTVPEELGSVRSKLADACDQLRNRIACMQQALKAIDSMNDPTSEQIDSAISGYMEQSGASYKRYKKLEQQIANELA